MLSTCCLWFPDSDAQVRNGTRAIESRQGGRKAIAAHTCMYLHRVLCTVYRMSAPAIPMSPSYCTVSQSESRA
jgi:hypothetical protein